MGGRGKRFELWNAEKNELLVSREGHPTTRCAVFSPDNKTLATGGDDRTIMICDSTTRKTQKTLAHHRGSVSVVIFADHGQTLVSGCDGGEVKLWDTTTGQAKATWREHKQQIYCANISPDGKWLITGGGNWTTGDPGELFIWELKTGQVRARLKGHKLAIWSIVINQEGTLFAASDSSGAVRVWNLQTHKEEQLLQHSTWRIGTFAGRQHAGRRSRRRLVRFWDTATWTEKAACDGNESFTFSLQFAPNGKTLACSDNDGTVRFWQTGL